MIILKPWSEPAGWDPANYRVLLDLGLAYGMRYNFEASERCLDKAVRVAPQKAEVLAMAGTHCRNVNRFELARKYFERAVEEPRVSPDTFVKLAEVYERFRLLEQAQAMVGRALEMNRGSPLALLVRARLDRLSGRLEEAERSVRSFLGDSDPNTWSTRIRGWYELGAILDRQERFDEAMAAFLEAKALIRPNAERFSAPQQSVRAQLERAARKSPRKSSSAGAAASRITRGVSRYCAAIPVRNNVAGTGDGFAPGHHFFRGDTDPVRNLSRP